MADKTAKRETAGRRKRPGQRGRSVPPGAGDDSDRASPPAASKPRKQTDPPSDPTGGATGCEVDVNSRTVEGRNGGILTPHPPGSNGGVKRGPDRFPGRNVVRSTFLIAMAADGLSLQDLRRNRKHRKGHSLIPFAMSEHCKQGYKNIAIDAALGKSEAYGPFLRMMADAHTILQPAKDEVARAQDRVPRPATFIVSRPAPSTEESSQPPAHSPVPARGPLDGYVEA